MFVCVQCGERYERPGRCDADGGALAAATDELLGERLGPYRVAKLIGEGGMGRVYLAVHPEIGARVAIKVLASSDQGWISRFFAEARAVNVIRHEHIVDVLDLARLPDGRPYIVMELVDGQTLRDVVRAGPAPLGATARLMVEVLSALHAAHAVGIVHRDLKPDNIAITAGGHAKVLDFGVAKIAPKLRGPDARATATGATVGTPEYMAPEQVLGGDVDGRTDVYAAGIVLYEAVTGMRPFSAESDFEVMRAQVDVAPPAPRVLRPDLPVELEAVILRALAKRAGDRFASAAEMASALAAAVARFAPAQLQPFVAVAAVAPIARRSAAMTVRERTPEREAPATVRARPVTPARAEGRVAEEPAAAPARRPEWKLPVMLVGVFGVAAGISGYILTTQLHHDAPASAPAVVAARSPANDAAVVAIVPIARPSPDAAIAPAPPPADAAVAVDAGTRSANTRPRRPADARRPAPADAGDFDISGYIPTARALARETFSDAELFMLNVEHVQTDGHVTMAPLKNSAYYLFVSPSRPDPHGDDPACAVAIVVDHVRVLADVPEHLGLCSVQLTPAGSPHCTIAAVWKRAIERGADPKLTATVSWGPRHAWKLTLDDAPAGTASMEFDDQCD